MDTNTKSSQPEFNKFQQAIWPIHMFELKKFLPMSFLMFFILFIYTLVRDLKDTLVTNAPGGSSETLSVIKFCGVLPMSIVAVIVFSKLINKFSFQKVFYILISFFLIFFGTFGFIIYPLSDKIHVSAATIQAWQISAPALKAFSAAIGNWSFSLFYILAELWGSLVISSLFWQFANNITMKNEVKRYFGLFACIGNFGLIFSGLLVIYLGRLKKSNVLNFSSSVKIQMATVLISGTALLLIFYYLNKKILSNPRFYDSSKVKEAKQKVKLSVWESLKCIFTNPYLMLIAVLVLAYGVSINLSEVTLKGQGILYNKGDKSAYNAMMGSLSLTTGIITIIVTLTASNILRRCKWKTSALITPISILVLGSLFFSIVMYENNYGVDASLIGINVLSLAVFFGIGQDALAKGIKYSLFDSTKNMAYLPLDPDLKSKGQAAVEVIGGRLGKGLGSIIVILLQLASSGAALYQLPHVVTGIVAVVVALWIIAVVGLNKKYVSLNKQNESK